jgi:hypothetical protein
VAINGPVNLSLEHSWRTFACGCFALYPSADGRNPGDEGRKERGRSNGDTAGNRANCEAI